MVSTDETGPPALDPHRQFADRSHTILQQIFEGLVRFSPEGKLEPALALAWKRLDPLSTEFTLRPGVTFHDGEPFDAETVRFTMARYLDPATGFPARAFLDPIERVQVVTPLKIVIRTSRPDGLLLYRLAAFVLIVPPRAAADPKSFGLKPIGTGPFRFVSWVPGERIEMEANPGYWLPGLPRVKRLVFRFMPQDKMREALFEGTVDVVPYLPGTWTLDVTRHPRTQVHKVLSWVTYLGSLNTIDGPLAKAGVRRALNHAIDRERLVRFFCKGNGRPLATTSMFGEFGRDEGLAPYPYDPAKARALLAAAGYKDGLKLKLLVKDTARAVMGVLAGQWTQVGVTVEQTETTDARMFADVHRERWDGFFAMSPEPMAHMGFLPGIGVYSKGPFALVRDPAFDALYERMVSTLEPAAQEQLCHQLDRMMYQEAFNVVTFQQIRTIGAARALKLAPSVTGMDHFMHASW